MNGFISTVLSLMLSWLRALISNLWGLINSDGGGTLYQFLAAHWFTIAVILCIGGVALDVIIYFFRWRPDYVWRSKLRRPADDTLYEEEIPPPAPYMPEPAPQPVYAPVAYEPPQLEESDVLWDADVPEGEWGVPAQGLVTPQPVNYQDVQAGFAPPVPPEQLYVPSASYQSPVHPGLNEEAFRQSFGLQTDEEARQDHAVPVMHAPAFRPFTAVQDSAPAKAPSAFSRFAKRARNFVVMNEEDPPTLADLQTNVDVSQAFHAPVYPQPMDHKEG